MALRQYLQYSKHGDPYFHLFLPYQSQQCISHQPHSKELSLPLQYPHIEPYDMQKRQGYYEKQSPLTLYPYQFLHNHMQHSDKSSHVLEVPFHNHCTPTDAAFLQVRSPLFQFFDYILLSSLSKKNTADKLQYVQIYHGQYYMLIDSKNKLMDYPLLMP